ncbi:MAG: ATP-binding protein [Woeseiaceae bacterium]
MKTKAPEDLAEQGLRGGVGGIGGRLLASFLFLAALPVLGALIVFGARGSVQGPLDLATSRSVEFNEAAVAVSQDDQEIGALMSSGRLREMGIEAWQQAVFEKGEKLVFDARRLDRFMIENHPSGRREDGQYFDAKTLRVQELLIAIAQTESTLSAQRTALQERVAEVSSASDVVEAQLRAMKSLASTEANDQISIELTFAIKNLQVIANALIGQQSEKNIKIAEADYRSLIRDLAFGTSQLNDRGTVNDLSESLSRLYAAGANTNNIFSAATEISLSQLANSRFREELRVSLNELTTLLAQEERHNIELARSGLYSANAAFSRMGNTLILIGVFSLLFSGFIVYWYVYKNLLSRLGRLADATQRLSRGELSVPIERWGNDELTVIGSGLEVFRSNAEQLSENEHMLQSKTDDLELVNKELDKFAYVASHDLRAPLRAIENLAGFIREDIGDEIPTDSQKHLDLMSRRIKRLDALLTSLLEYSRVGRTELKVERVALHRLIDEIADILSTEGFDVRVVGETTAFYTYSTPLEQLIRNLIDNAQKHHDKTAGVITVKTELVGSMLHLIVSDDGPGIPKEFHERVFGMFQTLKPRDDTEGSGMGLAILQKLTDSFGGRIRVESDPEQKRGTTFFVEWPVFADENKSPR